MIRLDRVGGTARSSRLTPAPAAALHHARALWSPTTAAACPHIPAAATADRTAYGSPRSGTPILAVRGPTR